MSQIYDLLFRGKAAAWTAASTVMMMIFSGLLWHVSNMANETNIATQRAMLSSGGPALLKIPAADGKTLKGVNVIYFWTNSGTTPAKDGKAQFNISLGATHPSAGLDFNKLPQAQTNQFVLGPKAVFQVPPAFISREDLESVEQGRQHLFFWGWVTYQDGFPNTPKRLTEFCTDVASGSFTKVDHSDLTGDFNTSSPPCEVHNCYDEQCADYATRIE